MGLSPRLVGEYVEDTERRRRQLDREPRRRGGLLVGQRQPTFEERGHFGLLAGLGDETNPERNTDHGTPPWKFDAQGSRAPPVWPLAKSTMMISFPPCATSWFGSTTCSA